MDDACRAPHKRKLPETSDREATDRYVALFEQWFTEKQKAAGMEGAPLISVEHAIVRSFISWLSEA